MSAEALLHLVERNASGRMFDADAVERAARVLLSGQMRNRGDAMNIVKPLSEITRDEWIVLNWVDVAAYCDSKNITHMIRGKQRTPSEGARAADEWDIWVDAAHKQHAKGNI